MPNGLAALRWIPDTVVVPPTDPGNGISFALTSANPRQVGDGSLQLRLRLGAELDAAIGRVDAYDANGRRLRAIWSGLLQSGSEVTIGWDGTDGSGRALRPGLYFLRFEAAGRHQAVRFVSLR